VLRAIETRERQTLPEERSTESVGEVVSSRYVSFIAAAVNPGFVHSSNAADPSKAAARDDRRESRAETAISGVTASIRLGRAVSPPADPSLVTAQERNQSSMAKHSRGKSNSCVADDRNSPFIPCYNELRISVNNASYAFLTKYSGI
jgi:hypothetical protein